MTSGPQSRRAEIVVADSTMAIFQKSSAVLASQEAPTFEREDWSLFRTVEGLQQRAGVPKRLLSRLVIKELADNGLDNGAVVTVQALPDGGYLIEDDGTGIDGTPEDIARLFSINRPMVSTKLLRLPTRGALGNGLRVVTGAALASGGFLFVTTHNRRIGLRPERDGTTTVTSVKAVKFPVGTRIEVSFGSTLPCDGDTLYWARLACRLAQLGTQYLGKSSPWWYDAAQFHELLFAAGGNTPVRELIANLDGCTCGKAGEIVAQAKLERAICRDVTLPQAVKLLETARANARQVQPKRLGAVGPQAFLSCAYAVTHGVASFGSARPQAEIPFVVEAWAEEKTEGDTYLGACVNRTPATGDLHAARDKRDIDAFGCGLSYTIAKAPSAVQFNIWINVTTPYMPITSDGKAPDLKPFLNEIQTAVSKAVRKAHRPEAGSRVSQKDIVLDNLDAVIADVSGDGRYRFNQRQLLYRLRPIVRDELRSDLTTTNFAAIITDFESEKGEIPGMYREPRGTIYHPHRDETITLGTLMVEDYERPLWTFNKLVYIEKEGFSEALKGERWPERHDCALLSSKGFTTRAARDLVDLLAEHGESVTIFCAHDADAFGTMIYQTFQEQTKARGARKIKIINLGLEPWEALAMDLEVEAVKEGDRRKPVANYVADHPGNWAEWLQTNRVELNAMTTPEFIAWLDGKMTAYSKLIPPDDVLEAELDKRIEEKVRADITERILRDAGLDNQVATAVAAIEKPSPEVLAEGIRQLFQQEPDREWRDHIEAIARERGSDCRDGEGQSDVN
jgi:Topoisomerase 6 subunit A/Spo11, Toprim domain